MLTPVVNINSLKNDLGNLGENKLLLITAVKVMDEYYETKKKVEQKKNELKDLSNKFRELKNLVYDYRDKKELEINGVGYRALVQGNILKLSLPLFCFI